MITGSIQTKNNMLYMVINHKGKDGKRKPRWESTHLRGKGNKKRAEQMLSKRLDELNKQNVSPDSQIPFDEYIMLWLNFAKSKVDEVTYQGYEQIVTKHIIPYFKNKKLKLCDITRKVLQSYFDEKSINGRLDGKGGLKHRSLVLQRTVINQTLNKAIIDELISVNPCSLIELPKGVKREPTFYTSDEINKFLELIKNETIYPIIKITTVYGLRRSEVMGLQWKNVDFEGNCIKIRHTVVKVSQLIRKNKTKNTSSRRTMPITSEIKEMLLKIKADEDKNRFLFGNSYNDNDYVFKWPDGKPISPDYASQKFRKLLKKHAFEHIRFHDLRHSCASICLSNGFQLKDVQEWLGHADIKMTANVYGHLDLGRKTLLADAMSGIISE